MVNNAGVNVEAMQPVTIHETSERLFNQTVAINTKGVFLGLKYATAQMMKQDPHPSGDLGWIINISSITLSCWVLLSTYPTTGGSRGVCEMC